MAWKEFKARWYCKQPVKMQKRGDYNGSLFFECISASLRWGETTRKERAWRWSIFSIWSVEVGSGNLRSIDRSAVVAGICINAKLKRKILVGK